MAPNFDPYAEWLGISPRQRPLTHYDLLGLAKFESTPEAIREAANRRIDKLQAIIATPRGQLAKKVLVQVEAARACLLNPELKRRYDQAIGGPVPPPLVQQPAVEQTGMPLEMAALEALVQAEVSAVGSPVRPKCATIDWASRVQHWIYLGGFVGVLLLSLLLGLVVGRNAALIAAEFPIWHESAEEVKRVAASEIGKRPRNEREQQLDHLAVKYMSMFAAGSLASVIIGSYYLLRY